MKRVILILIIIAEFSSTIIAQKTLSIDFNGDKLEVINNPPLSSKEFDVTVNGICTSLHKVIVEFDDFYWYSETPDALKSVFPGIITTTHGDASMQAFERLSLSLRLTLKEIKADIDTINAFYKFATNKYSRTDDRYLNDIRNRAYTDTSDIKDLSGNISHFYGIYEAQLEMAKGSYNAELAELLADGRALYDYLKKNEESILSAAKAIIETAEEGAKKTFTSKVHTFSKTVSTAKIYVIDRFDVSDTLAALEYDLYKAGAFSVDFSAGVGINGLVKPQFYIGDNSGSKFIGNEQKRDVDFGAIALIHLQWKICPAFALGAATGVSVSFFDANTALLFGPSLMFGKKRTIALSGGGILGKTTVLSRKVSSNGITVDGTLPTDLSSAPTADAIKPSWFISVTYNLSRTKKKD